MIKVDFERLVKNFCSSKSETDCTALLSQLLIVNRVGPRASLLPNCVFKVKRQLAVAAIESQLLELLPTLYSRTKRIAPRNAAVLYETGLQRFPWPERDRLLANLVEFLQTKNFRADFRLSSGLTPAKS